MLIIGKEVIDEMSWPTDFEKNQYTQLLSSCIAKDEDGEPLIRFRGEHGEVTGTIFQSRLPIISFADHNTALEYATSPNNNLDVIHSPRIHAGYLVLQFPVIKTDDPFIDLATLIDLFGFEETKKFALRNTSQIENTNAWEEILAEFEVEEDDDDGFDSEKEIRYVEDFIEQYPHRMGELCLLAYIAFDDEDISRMVIEAGFDGAIHGPFGIADEGYEHKIFDERQFIGAECEQEFCVPENIEFIIQTRFKKYLIDGIREKRFPITPQAEYVTKSDYYRKTFEEFEPVIKEMGSMINWNVCDYDKFEQKIAMDLSQWIKDTNFKNIAYLTASKNNAEVCAKIIDEQELSI